MLTRSKTMITQYVVDIDFDSASKEWLKNKIPLGCGTYKYKQNIDNTKPKKTIQLTHNYNLRSKKI